MEIDPPKGSKEPPKALQNPMSQATRSFLEEQKTSYISLAVILELDYLTRLKRSGTLVCMLSDRTVLTGEKILEFIESSGNVEIFEEVSAEEFVAYTTLRKAEEMPGAAATDCFDAAIAEFAIETSSG